MNDPHSLHLLKLQSWLSPAFPTGGFAYSHGLEWAVEAGFVHDRASLYAWIEDILLLGSGRNDAIVIAQTIKAQGDGARVAVINEFALALAPSSERLLESAQQGSSFVDAILESWPVDAALSGVAPPIAYPVAFGLAVGWHGISAGIAIPGFLNAFAANLVSAAIRLRVIGQRDGQKILSGLITPISTLVEGLADASLEDIGSATVGGDFAALAHETQDGRLFRS